MARFSGQKATSHVGMGRVGDGGRLDMRQVDMRQRLHGRLCPDGIETTSDNSLHGARAVPELEFREI